MSDLTIRTELITRARLMFLGPNEIRKAETRAINKALTSTTSFAVKLIRRDITASASSIKQAIKPQRATRSNPKAQINFQAKGIPLDQFKPNEKTITITRATRAGRTKPYQVKAWTVKVKKKKPRTLVRKGFSLPSGKFLKELVGPKRIPGKGVYATKRIARHKLQLAFGPSPATRIEPHINELMKYTRQRLDILLAQEIRYEDLKRRGQVPNQRTRS